MCFVLSVEGIFVSIQECILVVNDIHKMNRTNHTADWLKQIQLPIYLESPNPDQQPGLCINSCLRGWSTFLFFSLIVIRQLSSGAKLPKTYVRQLSLLPKS